MLNQLSPRGHLFQASCGSFVVAAGKNGTAAAVLCLLGCSTSCRANRAAAAANGRAVGKAGSQCLAGPSRCDNGPPVRTTLTDIYSTFDGLAAAVGPWHLGGDPRARRLDSPPRAWEDVRKGDARQLQANPTPGAVSRRLCHLSFFAYPFLFGPYLLKAKQENRRRPGNNISRMRRDYTQSEQMRLLLAVRQTRYLYSRKCSLDLGWTKSHTRSQDTARARQRP